MTGTEKKKPARGKDFKKAAEQLVNIGKLAYRRNWVPATSGNFSIRIADDLIAITVSGKHKGELTKKDIMPVDSQGKSLDGRKPSAETPIHSMLYSFNSQIGSVLHTHSVHATMLSRNNPSKLILDDYELLKAFRGIETHESKLTVPVFPNDQDTDRLAQKVKLEIASIENCSGFLIEGHGLYTWGMNSEDAKRHLEAFEFLFECEILKLKAGLK